MDVAKPRCSVRYSGSALEQEEQEMTTISASMVKELRTSTGAGMMDCKQALTEANGDMEAAVDWLRKKGLSKAAKKSDRVAAEGQQLRCGHGSARSVAEE